MAIPSSEMAELYQKLTDTLLAHEQETGFLRSLREIPAEQFEAYQLGLAEYWDKWLAAGLKHTHILFFTVILLGKVFEKVPTTQLVKAIAALLQMREIIDSEGGLELAQAVRDRNGQPSNSIKNLFHKWMHNQW